MVLVGVREGDTLDDVKWLAAKTASLRIFDDENGVMNRCRNLSGARSSEVSSAQICK